LSGGRGESLLDIPMVVNVSWAIMKTTVVLALATFALSPMGFGELKIPRTVFEMEQLDEAKAKAAEDEKPLIFVITDPGTS